MVWSTTPFSCGRPIRACFFTLLLLWGPLRMTWLTVLHTSWLVWRFETAFNWIPSIEQFQPLIKRHGCTNAPLSTTITRTRHTQLTNVERWPRSKLLHVVIACRHILDLGGWSFEWVWLCFVMNSIGDTHAPHDQNWKYSSIFNFSFPGPLCLVVYIRVTIKYHEIVIFDVFIQGSILWGGGEASPPKILACYKHWSDNTLGFNTFQMSMLGVRVQSMGRFDHTHC